MSILQYIDSDMFTPVYNNDIPRIQTPSITAICKELYYAIRNKEEIFIYGDYDMDGFCCNMVWKEVFGVAAGATPIFFQYTQRTHKIDHDILRQVHNTSARIVLICDTGSSYGDAILLQMLSAEGYLPIVLDHHAYHGDYSKIGSQSILAFNSFEERAILKNMEISGAYTSLLVARVLCEDYIRCIVPVNAKVYALASMYSDMVDLRSPIGRSLYNAIALSKTKGSTLIQEMNRWNYGIGRRLFSYIIAPSINSAFRMEHFNELNRLVTESERPVIQHLVNKLDTMHRESVKLVEPMADMFTQERFGEILFCVQRTTVETAPLHIRNYSGLIANKLANTNKCIAVVVIQAHNTYSGSYRDFYNRPLLSDFKLFMTAEGHPTAFGVEFTDLAEVKRHLAIWGSRLKCGEGNQITSISSSLIKSKEDLDALALYNEYMNAVSPLVITHLCPYAHLIRNTKYKRIYDVGLPLPVALTKPITGGYNILIEPAICKGVELRTIE